MFVLTIYFVCCGTPPNVRLPETYPTREACGKAGAVWFSPAANPQKAVLRFSCQRVRNGSGK
jgi:hypothetical protein